MRLGVDFSQWGGNLALPTVECWKGKGVDFAVVQYSALMRQHLSVLEAAGSVDIEAYVYLYWDADQWGQTPMVRTQNALNMAGGPNGFRIKRLWLDAEDSAHPYDEAQLWECVRICERAGMPTGIYTGRWWWVPRTGNSQAFAHLPLWDAHYLSGAPEPDLSLTPPSASHNFNPYGGWAKPEILQWHNTTTFCGHSVDLNVMEDAGIPAEEDYGPMKLNEDGSQRIEGVGKQIVFFNQNVPVLVIGDQAGNFPGRVSKLFGDAYKWLRLSGRRKNGSYAAEFNPEEGD